MIGYALSEVKAGPRPPKIGVPFAPLPLDVMRSRDLSPAAKLTFMALANHARMRRGEVSNLTNRRLAEATGQSEAAVRRGLDELESAGLIRRLFGTSQRVRVGVAVTYAPAEVAQGRSTQPAETVAPSPQPGCAGPATGCAPAPTDLLRTGEETPKTAPILPLVEDPGTPPDPATAAAYLRACVEAGRRGVEPPPPPSRGDRMRTEPAAPPPTVASPPPGPRLDDPRREVARMIDQLAHGFTARPTGPRRLSPQQLARQLAEVRRKHGAGKAPPRS